MWVNKFLKTTGSAALLSLACGVATTANAQTAYYQGTATLNDPVSVDMSVLEGLGSPPSLPELLNPSMLAPPTPITPPTPQFIAPMAIDNASMPTSGLEGVAPTAMKVDPPTAMKVEPTESAPAPAAAPTSGLADAAPVVAPEVSEVAPAEPEKVDEEMAAAIAATTAAEEAKAADAAAAKAAEAEAAAEEAAAIEAQKAAEAVAAAEATKIAEAEAAAKAAEDMAAKAAEEEAAKAAVAAEAEAPAADVESLAEEATPAIEEAEEVIAAEVIAEEIVEEAPAETQVASINPDAVKISEDGTVSIKFDEGSSDLPIGIDAALDDLAAKLTENEDLRVQLWGYATVVGDSPSQARRLSLFRALSVRTYLMKQGIRSTRMDVRALGDKVEDGPADRVDVVFPKKS